MRGNFRLAGRFFASGVFGRVENGEVPSTNFIKVVSLDPFGPGGPAYHSSLGIAEEDGRVQDGLDQQLELLLMFSFPRSFCMWFPNTASHELGGPVCGLQSSLAREIYRESRQGITGVRKANFILLDVRFLFA